MSAALRVLDPGLGNTVQDCGRIGSRHWGIPSAGSLDPLWAAAANVLLANPPAAAVLELRLLGPRLQAEGAEVTVALAGAVSAVVERTAGTALSLPGWCAVTLQPGDILRCGPVQGLAYMAVPGGIDVPLVLGSRATYERVSIGGLGGRALRTGDRIACLAAAQGRSMPQRRGAPLVDDEAPIRVIPGPQDDHFSDASLAMFYQADWRVTHERDRMGMRLAGPALAHCSAAHADIISDGVAPGAIQVPAVGRPIVLLRDAQTVGGYPKIATVIRADLGRLARWPLAKPLRFEAVTLSAAHAAWRAQVESLQRWGRALQPWSPAGELDPSRLYEHNLISGVVFARANDEPCAKSERCVE